MIKGTRIQANNTYAVGTSTTVYVMLNIPTGKTFVLTDIAVVGSTANDISNAGPSVTDTFKLFDYIGSGGTAGTNVSTAKLTLNFPLVSVATTGTAVTTEYQRGGIVLHFTNGPEFSTGVTPGMGGANSQILNTGCVWIGGLLR